MLTLPGKGAALGIYYDPEGNFGHLWLERPDIDRKDWETVEMQAAEVMPTILRFVAKMRELPDWLPPASDEY